jgi:hypothetical protein
MPKTRMKKLLSLRTKRPKPKQQQSTKEAYAMYASFFIKLHFPEIPLATIIEQRA